MKLMVPDPLATVLIAISCGIAWRDARGLGGCAEVEEARDACAMRRDDIVVPLDCGEPRLETCKHLRLLDLGRFLLGRGAREL